MKQRALKYDVIRIVASCMVVFIHVSAGLVLRYQGVGNLFNNLSRVGVPMFLLTCGVCLLVVLSLSRVRGVKKLFHY